MNLISITTATAVIAFLSMHLFSDPHRVRQALFIVSEAPNNPREQRHEGTRTNQQNEYYVTALRLNVRPTASTEHPPVRTLNFGQIVNSQNFRDGWMQIGHRQWISERFTTLVDEAQTVAVRATLTSANRRLPIELDLILSAKNEAFGRYRYEQQSEYLFLRGSLEGNRLSLDEVDRAGLLTGLFELNINCMTDLSCRDLGTWWNPSANTRYSVQRR